MSGLVLPKVIYPSGGGSTLNFVFPPRKVPYRVYAATRHDNIASAGVRESIFERVDTFLQFDMEYVNIGSDVAAWDSFIQNALQGIPFDYYPDATLGSFVTYYLEGTTWTAAYKQLAMYTFTMKFRLKVGWP